MRCPLATEVGTAAVIKRTDVIDATLATCVVTSCSSVLIRATIY